MPSQKNVVIISVPYCEPLPKVAPVLLAGCLEAGGISAKGIDFNIDFLKHFSNEPYYIDFKHFLVHGHLVNPTFSKHIFKQVIRFTKNFISNIVIEYQPQYIGLSIFSHESLDFGLLLSYVIRRWFPDVSIIAGGKGIEVTGSDGQQLYDLWNENNVADLIIVGDAETEIIDSIKNNKRGIIFAKPQTKEDLDFIPPAKWEDYDLSVYRNISSQIKNTDYILDDENYLSITGSKGCVRQCSFCDVADFWPDYLYRDPVKVANEMIHNYENTGIRKFMFTDNLINGSISNFRKMNEVLVERLPRTISYGGYAIFRGKREMPEDDFRLAAEAGNSYWTIGVESGSERVRYDMKKKFTNDDIDWTAHLLAKYEIKQKWLLMVGYPTETEKDFQDTLDLLTRYESFARKKLIQVSITPTFSVLNNSPIIKNAKLAEEYGLSHFKNTDALSNKFWTSTRFLDNDFPTRSRRWKTFVAHSEALGYERAPGMPVEKWRDEIENLDRIYAEQKNKFIPIHRG